jgi:probable phosphoglycerate mutase
VTGAGRVVVEADGGSRGNPGPAGYGAVVLDGDSGEVLVERNEFLGVETNNVAEYRGLIAGLTAARDLGATDVTVRMDSKLVVEQMSGRWQVKHPAMRPLAREAVALRHSFESVSFEWIPRSRNTRADRLANLAMDSGTGSGTESTVSARETTERPARQTTGRPTQQTMWLPPEEATTRLILVRHGATDHSPQHRFSGRNDLPLNSAGRAQAAALAARLPSFGAVAAVISSPLPRARQTAEAIAAELALSVSENAELAEVDFGSWEGMTFDEARADSPEEMTAWLASPDHAPPGGESFTALARRVRRARDAVLAAHQGARVVLVSHVAPIKTLLRLALDAPPASMFRIHLDPASVSVVDYGADGASSVRLVNDVCHLTG